VRFLAICEKEAAGEHIMIAGRIQLVDRRRAVNAANVVAQAAGPGA
jgi:hypothetical protein